MSSSYRFSRPFVVRVTGLAVVATGVLVLVLVAASAAFSTSAAVVPVVVLPVLLAVVLLSVLARRRAVVVRFDDAGYRIRYVRGAGVRQAGWREVEDVAAATVAGERCVVLRLRDGTTSTVPVDVLGVRTEDFVEDLRAHLDRGHGYRRVPPAAR